MRRWIGAMGAGLLVWGLGACLMPDFSNLLPSGDAGTEAAAPDASDAGSDDADGGALVGCDDPTAIAIWPLTEGTGTTVHDCKGKYPGTFTGQVSWTQGRKGDPAIQFGGGSIVIADSPDLLLSGPFTVTAWIEASNSQVDLFGDVVSRYKAGGQGVWGLAVTKDPFVELNVFSGGNIAQVMTGAAFTWAHVAATYTPSSGKIELYLSGNLKQTNTGPAMLTVSTVGVTFGANGDGTSIFHGGLSQVRLYDRILGANEISAIANK